MPGIKGQRSGGHNAKTRKELELTGGYRATRHAGVVNPDPPKGLPERPKAWPPELAEDAEGEWGRMVERLTLSRTIAKVDDGMLYQHCCLFAETERLVIEKAEARASVDVLLDSQGDIEKGDLLAFFIELGKMRKLAASYDSKLRSNRMALRVSYVEFGLTPASRGRVKMTEPTEPTDPFAEFDGIPN